jgi:DNA-binding NarL/FixJ family response regulator
VVRADDERVKVQYAAIAAAVEGRSLILTVTLRVTRRPQRSMTAGVATGRGLSARELEVVAKLALGLRAHEIARELGIETSTVQSHVRHAMKKCGARSQAQLVAVVCAHGLLDPRSTAAAT